jgi:hypothetical protein
MVNKEILNEIDFENEARKMKLEGNLDIFIARQVYDMCKRCEVLEKRASHNASNITKLTIAVIVLACTTGGGAYSIVKFLL